MIERVLTSTEIDEYLNAISKQVFRCLFRSLSHNQLETLKVNVSLRCRTGEINERERKQLNKAITSM